MVECLETCDHVVAIRRQKLGRCHPLEDAATDARIRFGGRISGGLDAKRVESRFFQNREHEAVAAADVDACPRARSVQMHKCPADVAHVRTSDEGLHVSILMCAASIQLTEHRRIEDATGQEQATRSAPEDIAVDSIRHPSRGENGGVDVLLADGGCIEQAHGVIRAAEDARRGGHRPRAERTRSVMSGAVSPARVRSISADAHW